MKKLLAVTLINILMVSHVYAAKKLPFNNLGSLIETQLIKTSEALEGSRSELRSDKEWLLNTIRLRLRPSIGVEISWLAKATLKPEIEFYFTR